MKKIILSIVATAGFYLADAQINIQSDTQAIISQENPFLDASGYTVGPNSIGKGLYFPRTDLTQWEFKKNQLGSYSNFKTAFDGMVVYNTVSGFVGGDNPSSHNPSTMGKRVPVEPGFYYFSNPTADVQGEFGDGAGATDISNGEWKKIGGADLSAGIDNGKFWTLNGNSGTTEATIDESNNNAITAGNFIGTTDAKSLTVGTNNIARLNIGAIPETVGTEPFDFVLKVYGKAKFDDGIVTKASTYPDYVFDNYFTGTSEENPNYEFKKLDEVENFIKENNHLPGVTSIKELTKSENGYNVDNTQLSIQTLEKVEELYLHVIEQQKEIQALKAEIAELKK